MAESFVAVFGDSNSKKLRGIVPFTVRDLPGRRMMEILGEIEDYLHRMGEDRSGVIFLFGGLNDVSVQPNHVTYTSGKSRRQRESRNIVKIIKDANVAIHNICSKFPMVNLVQISIPPVAKFLASDECPNRNPCAESIPQRFRQFQREGRNIYRFNNALQQLSLSISNFAFIDFDDMYFDHDGRLITAMFGSDGYHISSECAKNIAQQVINWKHER